MNSKNEEKIYQSIGVEPVINSVTDGMAAEHTRNDRPNGLFETKDRRRRASSRAERRRTRLRGGRADRSEELRHS